MATPLEPEKTLFHTPLGRAATAGTVVALMFLIIRAIAGSGEKQDSMPHQSGTKQTVQNDPPNATSDVAALAAAEIAFVATWIAEHPRPTPIEIPAPVPPRESTPAENARFAAEGAAYQERTKAANADFEVRIAQWSNAQLAAIAAWRKARTEGRRCNKLDWNRGRTPKCP
jgi:hypothetical protein